MRGQWRGTYSGTNNGEAVVEIDELADGFEGTAYLYEADPALPATFAFIRTPHKNAHQEIDVQLAPIDPRTDAPTTFDQIKDQYPDVVFGSVAKATLDVSGDQLTASWSNDIGNSGSLTLSRYDTSRPSTCRTIPVSDWKTFKDFVAAIPTANQLIFRGQPGEWRLRTSFHRSGRANLHKYLIHDMPVVYRHLSAMTKNRFDARDPLQNAAFFNLIQHHGFPTPLLDWTYSPFVAAFFAYLPEPKSPSVRVYVFDKYRWCNSYPQIQNTNSRRPHFSMLEALAIENERMIPQQALLSFTNVDDIESYLDTKKIGDLPFLHAIDLPSDQRRQVLAELRLMGITSGSMFPGLDGACSELRARLFGD